MAPLRSKISSNRARAIRQALKRIRLFATDVDGVLTDSGMYYSESGDEIKKFNTRDGMGIKLLQRAGLITALITQEDTKLVARRAERLAIPEVHQRIFDKLTRLRDIATRYHISLEEIAYMGDDVVDLPVLTRCGLALTVPDAPPLVKKHADYVSVARGGHGAAREVCELIMHAQGTLDRSLEFYLKGS